MSAATEQTVDLSGLTFAKYAHATGWTLDGAPVDGHRHGTYFDELERLLHRMIYEEDSLPDRLYIIQPGGRRVLLFVRGGVGAAEMAHG